MRFMMLMIPKGYEKAAPGTMPDAGEGRMEITESSPPHKVVFAMHFIEPFEVHNTAKFTLEPQGDSMTVTWASTVPSPILRRSCISFSTWTR